MHAKKLAFLEGHQFDNERLTNCRNSLVTSHRLPSARAGQTNYCRVLAWPPSSISENRQIEVIEWRTMSIYRTAATAVVVVLKVRAPVVVCVECCCYLYRVLLLFVRQRQTTHICVCRRLRVRRLFSKYAEYTTRLYAYNNKHGLLLMANGNYVDAFDEWKAEI